MSPSFIARVDTVVFDPRPKYPFRISAKKYTPRTSSEDGFTFIFAHGTGHHKEQWEVTIDRLFELSETKKWRVREAWSLDCPNHGDAAVLNEDALDWGYSEVFDWQEYGRYIHVFLTTYGNGSYFPSHKLVGIGHSMGGTSLILSTMFLPYLKFHSLVLCETMLFPKPLPGTAFPASGFIKSAHVRRDIWPSKSEALAWMRTRKGFADWHPKVLEIYAMHGLRDLPTATYPDKTKSEGVTLKCPKLLEAACYADTAGKSRALKYLPTLCKEIPVHIIWGEIDDQVPHWVHDLVVDMAGEHLKSAVKLPGSGHLVVQTKPVELADYIYSALIGSHDKGRARL